MYRSSYSSFGRGITPAIKNLLIANAAVFGIMFLPYYLFRATFFANLIGGYFSLIPAEVTGGFQIWRVVSYMFIHANFSHILFNMFALWMFGTSLEQIWGSKEFYKFYFLTGIFAGISSVIFNFGSFNPIVGASGAVYGILMAVALLFPEQEVYLYFLFPVKMKYFALGLGAIEFFTAMAANNDGIAHFAHLGGMVAGYLYLKSKYGNRIEGFGSFFKKKY